MNTLPCKSRREYRVYCKQANAAFFKEVGNGKVMVEYIRNYQVSSTFSLEESAPVGVMVAYLDDSGVVKFGFSFKHSTKEKHFDKPIGLHKAIERARLFDTFPGDNYRIPDRCIETVDEFMEAAIDRLTLPKTQCSPS